MIFSTRQYFRNWGLYVRGVRWLWTREFYTYDNARLNDGIFYKRPWSPLTFLLMLYAGWIVWLPLAIYFDKWWLYALAVATSDYGVATLLGLPIVSLSRWWYDRSHEYCTVCGLGAGPHHGSHVAVWATHPFSRFMTRLLDWAFPGSAHGRHTGPILRGSRSAWG